MNSATPSVRERKESYSGCSLDMCACSLCPTPLRTPQFDAAVCHLPSTIRARKRGCLQLSPPLVEQAEPLGQAESLVVMIWDCWNRACAKGSGDTHCNPSPSPGAAAGEETAANERWEILFRGARVKEALPQGGGIPIPEGFRGQVWTASIVPHEEFWTSFLQLGDRDSPA